MNSFTKKNEKQCMPKTNRRAFMRLLFGSAAGVVLAPALISAANRNSVPQSTGKIGKGIAQTSSGFQAASGGATGSYPYQLPALPYAFNALEPAIFERTMIIHHGKHHSGYTNKLNAALENQTDLQKQPLVDLLSNLNSLPKEVQVAVRNNGGGYYNHALFWQMMKPNGGGTPEGDLARAINTAFGSFESFQKTFSDAAKSLFGSGWAWLVANNNGELEILQTANQDTPLESGKKPVLGIDVWEHAYYLQYENRRAEYVDNFWNVVNWEQCGINFKA